MSRFRFTERAFRDIDLAVDDLQEKSPRAAEHFVDELDRKCELYADTPLIGIPQDEVGHSLRCLVVRPYLVDFRPVKDGIEIVRVLHGKMNIAPDMFTE